jgi:serine/threonine protein kinase
MGTSRVSVPLIIRLFDYGPLSLTVHIQSKILVDSAGIARINIVTTLQDAKTRAAIPDESSNSGKWYIAPEVLRGSESTCKSDIYSMTMLIWEVTFDMFRERI